MISKVLFKVEDSVEMELEVSANESLLDAAKKAGIAIDAPCSGNGTCGKCRVKVIGGKAESGNQRFISPDDYADGWRLACASQAESDLTVLVPASAGAYKNRIKITELQTGRDKAVFERLRGELRDMGYLGSVPGTQDSGIELLPLALEQASLDDPLGDRERLLRGIAEKLRSRSPETPAPAVDLSLYALRKLPWILRESSFACTCVLREESSGGYLVLDIFPAGAAPLMTGLAIDIGTTTVAGVLMNIQTGEVLATGSGGNGQIRYGADVINRIIESTRPGGLERLRKAISEDSIIPLVRELSSRAGIPLEQIYRVAVAANTTMTHLFLGVYPDNLRLEPYVPAFFQAGQLRCVDSGLELHPNAELLLSPAVGSYVGGDISAGVFSSMIFKKRTYSLFIDLGTNGELVFGNDEFLMTCACSAGPAFEGGDISCGMRATDGAVEACRIDEATMEPTLTVIGNGKPVGLCGSGLIDMIGELFRCGIINARGKLVREGKRIRRDEYGMGSYTITQNLSITEGDIDNFIRAKGAIFSAIRTMLTMLDFSMEAIEDVYIAGGIGSGINVEGAIRIGMLPKLPAERYHYIGNTSLYGAYAMAISCGAARRIAEIAQGLTYLELSAHSSYMDEFIAACFLPHTNGALFT
ncbi:MAG: ASKHA domain-containing protein [Treponema sp.]|jgi:uncharacterized 2Fe-2S/4Fe-4S cluster protein (DUF4445 family)|nr:ASKHA domain-containing protein [Treponema sp.]